MYVRFIYFACVFLSFLHLLPSLLPSMRPIVPSFLFLWQMMVEACFQGNSPDPQIKITQILVG